MKLIETGSPEELEDWAHLGPSGRGLRSRGRRDGGGEGKVKGQQRRRGGKGRKHTARVSDSRQSSYQIGNHRRNGWMKLL